MTYSGVRIRGFTLIELLVVIAIIGVLSAVVLASLSTARGRANDSKLSSQLISMRTAAELYYGEMGSFGNPYGNGPVSGTCPVNGGTAHAVGLFLDTTSNAFNVIGAMRSTANVTVIACYSTATTWAVAASLPSNSANEYLCVDSRNILKKESGTLTANTITSALCP